MAGLNQIIALQDRAQIILVELPAPPHTRAAFRGGLTNTEPPYSTLRRLPKQVAFLSG